MAISNGSGVESRIKLNVNSESVESAINSLTKLKSAISQFGSSNSAPKEVQQAMLSAHRIEEIANRTVQTTLNAETKRTIAKQESEAKIQRLAEESATKQIAYAEQTVAKINTMYEKQVLAKEKQAANIKKINAQTELYNKKIEAATLKNKKYAESIENASEKTETFKKLLNFGTIVAKFQAIVRLAEKVMEFFEDAANYYENINLFNIVMGESQEKGEEFVSTLSEVFGLDDSALYRYIATFKGMANNMGIVEEKAYTMAESLTKMTYDLSALYNTEVEESFEALMSAVTGQVKSIRDKFAGIDITEASLEVQLDYMGITDKSISQFNYAEKSILRYLSIQRQASEAQGVFASEMMKPAQMIKLLGERITKLSRAIGNIFIPVLSKILPYAMAVIEVLTILAQIIANFMATIFGFDTSEFEESGVNTVASGISDDLDKATASAKKFKKQLQGFDVLNVINTTDTSSGSGSDTSGLEIDSRLLDAIDEWDMKLELASKRITEIRDGMLEWLGIEYDAVEGTYKLADGWTNIKKIMTIIGVVSLVKLAIGIGNLIIGVGNLITSAKILAGILSGSSAALSASTFVGGWVGGIGKIITKVQLLKGKWASVISVVKTFVSTIKPILTLLSGIILVIDGISRAVDTQNDYINDEISDTQASIGTFVSIVEGGIGGLLIGGPIGALVGAFGMALINVVALAKASEDAAINAKIHEKIYDNLGISISNVASDYIETMDNIGSSIDGVSELANAWYDTQENTKNAKDELALYMRKLGNKYVATDSNGTMSEEESATLDELTQDYKDALNEETDAFIELSSAIITRHGEMTGASAEDTANRISDMKALALAEQGYEEKYINGYKDLSKQLALNKISQQEFNEKVEELAWETGHLDDIFGEAQNTLYGFMGVASSKIDFENYETLEKSIKEVGKEYDESKKKLEDYYSTSKDSIKKELDIQNGIILKYDERRKKNGELSDAEAKRLKLAIDRAAELQQDLSDLAEDEIADYETLGSAYYDFLDGINTELIDSGANMSDEFDDVFKELDDGFEKLEKKSSKAIEEANTSVLNTYSDENLQKYKTMNNTFVGKIMEDGVVIAKEQSEKVCDAIIDGYDEGLQESEFENIGEENGDAYNKGIKKSLGINSPSKVMEENGLYTIEGMKNGLLNNMDSIYKVFEDMVENIEKILKEQDLKIEFSADIESTYNSILTKTQTFVNKFRSAINTLLSNFKKSMNGVQVGADNKITYTAMPSFTVPKFKNGGFLEEDGLFFANHNELVGKFSNGNTAVANNLQIEKGIEEAAYRGYSRAVKENGLDSQNYTFPIYIGGDKVDEITRKRQRRLSNMYGITR